MARRMAGMIHPRLRERKSTTLDKSTPATVVMLGVVTAVTGTGHVWNGTSCFN